MNYRIQAPEKVFKELVKLPLSKSIFNRYLILRRLSGMSIPNVSLDFPDDIKALINLLKTNDLDINTGDAGSVMRFGTALFSMINGERKISGSKRMHQRPIGVLVDALRQLGGDLEYLEKEGFPPLFIKGKKLRGGKVSVPVEISSQFISALLMISPLCMNSISIELLGRAVSFPYIEMTISLMKKMGIEVQVENNIISVHPQVYIPNEINIEKDWSSASFFYQIAALSKQSDIVFLGLTEDSIQGDRFCIDLFKKLGVLTNQVENGIQISNDNNCKIDTELQVDFTNTPDLLQPFVMTCAAQGINLLATGLYNLHIKETDRLMALKFNVQSIGGEFEINGNQAKLTSPSELNQSPKFKTFNDHRMAMSLAPLSIKLNNVVIETPQVVEKSFPNYWQEMMKLGFKVNEII